MSKPELDAEGWPKRPPHECEDCKPKPQIETFKRLDCDCAICRLARETIKEIKP